MCDIRLNVLNIRNNIQHIFTKVNFRDSYYLIDINGAYRG